MKNDSGLESVDAPASDDVADLSDETSDADDLAAEFDDAAPTVFEANELAAAARAESTRGRDTIADRGAAEIASESPALPQSACPECGIAVAPGYPRCPRCKASLHLRATTRDGAGGTSVVGRTVPWSIVGIAAVATAVIVYLSEREPPTAAAGDSRAAVTEVDDSAAVVPVSPDVEDSGPGSD